MIDSKNSAVKILVVVEVGEHGEGNVGIVENCHLAHEKRQETIEALVTS